MATNDGAEARKEIFRTTGILAGLTAFEFLLAGIKGSIPGWTGLSEETVRLLVLVTFVVLTIFKAFYIVAYFMHLKHEVRRLAFTIVLPFLFIIWLIIGLLSEGGYYGKSTKQMSVRSVNHVESSIA
ncbi:MAG: hypothetical protein EAZ89_13790 [Bacteroidetes bacterium]|jgi:cytochrome c oxidase subunit IV|nr:MAG: hypothetical protein EAZ89_13790 [Bacteroidota bacterium]